MKKTAILLSGGVDSLVAARLLKEQGVDVVGIHFITGFEAGSQASADRDQPLSLEESVGAAVTEPLSRQLDIPVYLLDVRHVFQTRVVDYFVHTYQQGMTPSPCMICNPTIKFKTALGFARKLGAERLATGHYARSEKDASGRVRLLRGKDRRKDQSYFLARLGQQELAAATFPLGGMHKTDTILLARAKGLQPVVKGESQDICFIKDGHYKAFLASQPGFKAGPGIIEDVHGRVIGEHTGLHGYTIGQRKGINCPASQAYYVIRIDAANNKLIVGFKEDGYSRECSVADINWLHGAPVEPVQVNTRIRYRHQATPSTVDPQGNRSALVTFLTPQQAVTPGQGAVFYDGEEVLGGGWITTSRP